MQLFCNDEEKYKPKNKLQNMQQMGYTIVKKNQFEFRPSIHSDGQNEQHSYHICYNVWILQVWTIEEKRKGTKFHHCLFQNKKCSKRCTSKEKNSLWDFTCRTFFLRINNIVIRIGGEILRNILSLHCSWIRKASQQKKQDTNTNSQQACVPAGTPIT